MNRKDRQRRAWLELEQQMQCSMRRSGFHERKVRKVRKVAKAATLKNEGVPRVVRAILIDPEKRTVTEIQFAFESDRDIQKILGCRSFASRAHFRGSLETGFDAIYVSDDALEGGNELRFWFQIDADRSSVSSYPIAGRGIVLGVDRDGATCDVGIGVAELQAHVTFTQRKFRGWASTAAEQGRKHRAVG
jgi:hypothetical protein